MVDSVSFDVAAGEKFGLVGESGSGKSVTALSILRLLEAASYEGEIRFEGDDVLRKSPRDLQAMRGRDIAMIFQEPMTALNSLYTIGNQIGEVLELHEGLDRARHAGARSSCWRAPAFPTRTRRSMRIRISSPAASGSAR